MSDTDDPEMRIALSILEALPREQRRKYLTKELFGGEKVKRRLTPGEVRVIDIALAAIEKSKTSGIDGLTGLSNRKHIDAEMDRHLARTKRNRSSVAVCMIDADHFKVINDTYGHQYGDEVLKAIANALKTVLRPDDLVGRFGGEEFVVCIFEKDAALAEKIESIAKRLMARMRKIRIAPSAGKPAKVTISMGIALSDTIGYDRASLIRAADKALYAAKEGGRDRYVLYTQDDQT